MYLPRDKVPPSQARKRKVSNYHEARSPIAPTAMFPAPKTCILVADNQTPNHC